MAFGLTTEDIEEAVSRFLPDKLSGSVALSGEKNTVELVAQTLALISNVLVRDADAPYYLRYLTSTSLLSQLQSMVSALDKILTSDGGLRSIIGTAPPTTPSTDSVDDAVAALDTLSSVAAEGSIAGSASSAFSAAMDALLLDLSAFATGTDALSVTKKLEQSVSDLRPTTAVLNVLWDRFGTIESSYRALTLQPSLLAHLTTSIRALLTSLKAVLSSQDRKQLAGEAKEYALRLAAARVVVDEIASLNLATANTLVDSAGLPTGTVLDANTWNSGEAGQSTSETAAVMQGVKGSAVVDVVVANGTEGFTADYENDIVAGVDPQAGYFNGYGPFSIQLDAGVLQDVAWAGAAVGALSIGHSAGTITGAEVVSGTVNYVTGLIDNLVFDTELVNATATIPTYSVKGNVKTNYFQTNEAVDLSGVAVGDTLRILVNGGPGDASGDGFEDRYKVLDVSLAAGSPKILKVGKFGTGSRMVAGGLPEPYDTMVWEVVNSVTTPTFKTLDKVAEPFWDMADAALGTYHTGRTDPYDSRLMGPGFPLTMTCVREEIFSGDKGWSGTINVPTPSWYDDETVLASVPELDPDATNTSLKCDGLYKLDVTSPAGPAAAGPYTSNLVQLTGGDWELKLNSNVPAYDTLVSNQVVAATVATQFRYEFTLDPKRVRTIVVGGINPDVPGDFNFSDDGSGNITGANVTSGSINYSTGECVVLYAIAPTVGNMEVTYRHKEATYTVTPLSKLMEDGVGAKVETTRRIRSIGATFVTDFESDPDTNPGPGDFLCSLTLRPFWFRIAAFLDEETILLQPVTYAGGIVDRFPCEYSIGNHDVRFFRAQPEASTSEEVHDPYVTPQTLPNYKFQNLIWGNTTNRFKSGTYSWVVANHRGWERVVLDPTAGGERRISYQSSLTNEITLDVYISDQLGNDADPNDDGVNFAIENIVHPGDFLQVPLDGDWSDFVPIQSITDVETLELNGRIPDHLNAWFAAGLDFRIVRSLAPTARLDVTQDMAADLFTDAGPFVADVWGADSNQVPGPASSLSPDVVRQGYEIEVSVGGRLVTSKIAGIDSVGGFKVLILADPILPPWKSGLQWRVRKTGPSHSFLLRRLDTAFDAGTLPGPGDKVCLWSTDKTEVDPAGAGPSPDVRDVVVDALWQDPLVSEPNRVLRTDHPLPPRSKGYIVVSRGDSRLASREAIVNQLLSKPTLLTSDFRELFQLFNEVRIQQASDESLVYSYPTANPATLLDGDGKVQIVRNASGEDWTAQGVLVGHLIHATFSGTGLPDVVKKSYVKTATEREVVLDPPLAVPVDASLSYPVPYTLSSIKFYSNDVSPLLLQLGAYRTECQTAVDVLLSYRAGRTQMELDIVNGVLALLEEAGLDRAKKLLEDGRITEFFAVTSENATFSQQALSEAATVLSSLIGP